MSLDALGRFIDAWVVGDLPVDAERHWPDPSALLRYAARRGYKLTREDLQRPWDDLRPYLDTTERYFVDFEARQVEAETDGAPAVVDFSWRARERGAGSPRFLSPDEIAALLKAMVGEDDLRLRFGTGRNVWETIEEYRRSPWALGTAGAEEDA